MYGTWVHYFMSEINKQSKQLTGLAKTVAREDYVECGRFYIDEKLGIAVDEC